MLNEPVLPQENIAAQESEELSPSPVLILPPIAGFWRRFLAWLIDSILLGLIGQLIGISFSSVLFSIGPYGRLIGLLFGTLAIVDVLR